MQRACGQGVFRLPKAEKWRCLAVQRQNQINTCCGKQGQQKRICKTKQNRILLFLRYTYYIVRRCV